MGCRRLRRGCLALSSRTRVLQWRCTSARRTCTAQRIAVEEFGILAAPLIERGVLRLMRGSYVLELLPNIDWNKGHAVQWILDRVRAPGGPGLRRLHR